MESAHLLIPKVAVLLPARNEEARIQRAILSLQKQNYPNFEVWLGDDQSSDQTFARMTSLCALDSRFHLISVPEASPGSLLRGKMNAIHYLGELAKGDIFLLTDADMELPPTWIETYVDTFLKNEPVGVVVGTTLVRGAIWQSLEWLWVLHGLSMASFLHLPTTGMGNNMAVSKKAWMEIGGYRDIPFSIVEDYALYHKVIQAGYGFKHVFTPEILGWTLPPENFIAQRTRWIRGAWQTASPWLLLTVFFLLMMPILGTLILISPHTGLMLAWVYYAISLAWGGVGAYRVRWKPPLWALFLSPWVLPLRLINQIVQAIFQKEVIWKNRHYDV